MINGGRYQSRTVTGYYEYLSTHRLRVDVAPHEKRNDDDLMTKKSPTTDNVDNSSLPVSTIDEGNDRQMTTVETTTDVTKWSSADVLRWIEEQCQKFELKKATTEKFQMNGQALVLLTKHDFLRRAPDGGEILYYALQKLINPKKSNSSARLNPNRSSTASPRIIEMDSDDEDLSQTLGSSLTVNPIIEEPDDLPSTPKANGDATSKGHRQQNYPYAFAYRTVHMRPPVFAMPTNAYYQPHYHHQQGYPQAYVYTQQPHHHHHHHPHHVHHHHPQMNQQFYHQQTPASFIHQYYPMMSAQGIMIEVIDNETISNINENGLNVSMNENSHEPQEQLYLVTINGQRQVMTEDQIRQLVTDVHQQQIYQNFQQQQQQTFQTQVPPPTSAAPPPPPPSSAPPSSSTQENLFFSS